MATFHQLANSYRVALILDALDIDELVAWADSEIETSTVPSHALVDVSLGRQLPKNVLLTHLTRLAEGNQDVWSIQRGMSFVANRLRSNAMSTETAVTNCYNFIQTTDLNYDDAFIIFYTYDDELSLIRDGVFSTDRLPQLNDELLKTLDEMANITRKAV